MIKGTKLWNDLSENYQNRQLIVVTEQNIIELKVSNNLLRLLDLIRDLRS